MQQSMQISLLCSTEHKEENMIFINSPFAILDEAFRSLYPDKKYKACIEPSIKDDEGNRVFGFTQFSKGETPVIAISAEEYQRLFQMAGIGHTWLGAWSGFVNGSSGWKDLRIIAWQPLPEPYREE